MTEWLAWLLDANVVSDMMRPRPESGVAAILDSVAEGEIGSTLITISAEKFPQRRETYGLTNSSSEKLSSNYVAEAPSPVPVTNLGICGPSFTIKVRISPRSASKDFALTWR